MSASRIDPVAWLLAEGRLLPTLPDLLDGICGRLQAHGFEPARLHLEVRTLHPEVEVQILIWVPHGDELVMGPAARVGHVVQHMPNGTVHALALAYGAFAIEAFKQSPLFKIFEGAAEVRCRIDPDATEFEYPLLADLQARDCTDYLTFGLDFIGGARSAMSLATRKVGGFTEEDLALVRRMIAPFAMCVDSHASRNVTRSLLRTYLGVEPGEHVLAGRIRRGDVERIQAAIWFSDLRGFTARSAAVDAEGLVDWLNAYFGTIAPPIEAEGGEILKFIGDAVLAVFPVTATRSPAEACTAAIRAARQANAAVSGLEAHRGEPFAHGIALHVGEVQYGNIGAEQRLDFTVIGPAVNLASRVEGLCGRLGRRTLATEAVATLAGEELPEAGTFELKGVAEPHVIYFVD